MAEQGKDQKPTQRRLNKAREDGNYPSAKEFVSALQFMIFLGLLGTGGARWFAGFQKTARSLFTVGFKQDVTAEDVTHMAWQLFWNHFAPLLAAVKKHKRIVKVGFNHRFHPAIMHAKQLADEAAIGPLLFIRGRYGHGGRIGYEKEWRFEKEISGGGELIDQGSHLIDLSRWFLGDLSLAYGAVPRYFWPGQVEDNCFLALTGAQNKMAWLHASWTEWKNQFSLEIMGRDGKLTIDGLGGSYGTERLTYHRMLPQMGPPETTAWEYPFPDRSFADEFENFVAAIEGRAKAIGDIEDAYANLAIIQAVYEQAKP